MAIFDDVLKGGNLDISFGAAGGSAFAIAIVVVVIVILAFIVPWILMRAGRGVLGGARAMARAGGGAARLLRWAAQSSGPASPRRQAERRVWWREKQEKQVKQTTLQEEVDVSRALQAGNQIRALQAARNLSRQEMRELLSEKADLKDEQEIAGNMRKQLQASKKILGNLKKEIKIAEQLGQTRRVQELQPLVSYEERRQRQLETEHRQIIKAIQQQKAEISAEQKESALEKLAQRDISKRERKGALNVIKKVVRARKKEELEERAGEEALGALFREEPVVAQETIAEEREAEVEEKKEEVFVREAEYLEGYTVRMKQYENKLSEKHKEIIQLLEKESESLGKSGLAAKRNDIFKTLISDEKEKIKKIEEYVKFLGRASANIESRKNLLDRFARIVEEYFQYLNNEEEYIKRFVNGVVENTSMTSQGEVVARERLPKLTTKVTLGIDSFKLILRDILRAIEYERRVLIDMERRE